MLLMSVTLAQEAQPVPLSYTDALVRAVMNSADLTTARVDLASARRELDRAEADPLALRIPVLQAEQAVTQARQALRTAELRAQDSAAAAYARALEAQSVVLLAEEQLALAQTRAEATQIRFEAGASTSLDVDQAQNTLQSARRTLADADEERELAFSQLASLLGLTGETLTLTETVPVGAVPPLANVLNGLEDNTQIVSARQAVALAEAQLAAVDNAFSARSEIDAARDTLNNAQTRLRETRRSLELGVRQSYNAVAAAQNRAQGVRAELEAAQDTLDAQQIRFDAGSISQLELAQNEIEVQTAANALESARHTLGDALRQLELTVLGGGEL